MAEGVIDLKRRMSQRLLGLLLVMTTCNQIVDGSIHKYINGGFSPEGNAFFFYGGSEGLYATSSADNRTGVQNGKSFIGFESVTFQRSQESASKHDGMEHMTGLIEAIVFEIEDKDKIWGSHFIGPTCCTPELAKVEGCTQGEIILHQSLSQPGWPWHVSFIFQGNNVEAKRQPDIIPIRKTGMYNLYFMFCDPQLKGTVINGRTVWKNPTGYLPGRMAPLMKFYGFLSLAYLVLGLAWFVQNACFWRDILQLQNCITVVIALGMCEMAMLYFEYVNFNATGHRPMGITIWAVTFGAVRETLSRLLLLVVSMGYGVVRPTLSGITTKMVLLGGIYCVASEILEIVENVGNINDLSGKARAFLVLPAAFFDALFILWIFTSLSKTLEKLQIRRSAAKLGLYRKFTNTLAVTVIVSVAWIGYELYFRATDHFGERWRSGWIITAFWKSLAFILLCIICVLWSPSHNATRYAFSEEVGDNFDEEEVIALTGGYVKPTVDVLGKPDRKERKLANIDVLSHEESLQEDKRE